MESKDFIRKRESFKDDDSTTVVSQVDFAENFTTQIWNRVFQIALRGGDNST